jgi:hypothetical protein
MRHYEYKVIDTDKHIEEQLNDLGAQGRSGKCHAGVSPA